MHPPWNIHSVELAVSKHFALKYMHTWNWDFHDLRGAIENAYQIQKTSKEKYEIYINKKGFKKIITVYYKEQEKLLCITASQGGNPHEMSHL